MVLFGTTTSPFTRRVRILATEVGEPIEWVDTAAEAGQAALRELSPIRKVPVAIIDGRTLFDSRVIGDWLVTTRGYGGLTPPRDPWRERNLVNAVDEAIGSVIQVFYLRRDGIAIDGNAFAQRQEGRTDAIFAWLGKELAAGDFGLPQLSVICALDWMEFRGTYPTERAAALAPIRAAWRDRPSIAATRPQT
ncbi:MAG TPA: glutathione S-transferase family protein [Kofleriaceae bacterium]